MFSSRLFSTVLPTLFCASLLVIGCGDSNVETVDRGDATAVSKKPPLPDDDIHAGLAGATSTAAGIMWAIPDGWATGPERQMRIATYLIGEGVNEADCAVFYFGPGQGGGIEANIDRWIGQFDQPDGSDSKSKASISKKEVNGLDVTTIELGGTYTASMGGPMSGKKEDRPGWHMLGAIIDAPEGPVFFKMTGPKESVVGATDGFDQLVASVMATGSA